jgi:hypothetical protein
LHTFSIEFSCVYQSHHLEVWTKPIQPDGTFAFAVLNTGEVGRPTKVDMTFDEIGLMAENGYNVTEAFSGKYLGNYPFNATFVVHVCPSCVFLGVAYDGIVPPGYTTPTPGHAHGHPASTDTPIGVDGHIHIPGTAVFIG